MKRGEYGGMDVAPVNTFRAPHFEFHVIFARCFPVATLLPTIPILYMENCVEKWWKIEEVELIV